MDCTFNLDDYLCGYTRDVVITEFHWIRKKTDRDNNNEEPVTDGSGSEIGMTSQECNKI